MHTRTTLLLAFIGLLLLCCSCNVSTYVLSTPNIPTIEKKGDFEGSINPSFLQFHSPGLGSRNEVQLAYSPLNRLIVQGNLLYGFYTTKISDLNWDSRSFSQIDYNLGLGYYQPIENHQLSFVSGWGMGRFNQARISSIINTQSIEASFGDYSRLYGQFNYTFFSEGQIILGIGIRMERNFYNQLQTLSRDVDIDTGVIRTTNFQSWEDRNLDVISPSLMLAFKTVPNEIHPYFSIGISNMQNWTDVHENRFYILFGLRFKNDFFAKEKSSN